MGREEQTESPLKDDTTIYFYIYLYTYMYIVQYCMLQRKKYIHRAAAILGKHTRNRKNNTAQRTIDYGDLSLNKSL
jgi:hypothetical protein